MATDYHLINIHSLVFVKFSLITNVLGTDFTVLTVCGSKLDGVKFFFTVHAGSGTHSASYSMGTGSLLRVKQPGRGVDQPPQSSAEVKERVELYFYSF